MDFLIYTTNIIHFLAGFSALALGISLAVMLLTNSGIRSLQGASAFYFALYAFCQGVTMQLSFYMKLSPELHVLEKFRYGMFCSAMLALLLTGLLLFRVPKRICAILAISGIAASITIPIFTKDFMPFLPLYFIGLPAFTVTLAALIRLAGTEPAKRDRKTFAFIALGLGVFFLGMALSITVQMFYGNSPQYMSSGLELLAKSLGLVVLLSLLLIVFTISVRGMEHEKQKWIFIVVSITTGFIFILSAFTIPVILEQSAKSEVRNKAEQKAKQLLNYINTETYEAETTLSMLASSELIRSAFENRVDLQSVNNILNKYSLFLKQRIFYLLDLNGTCIAGSNTMLIGQNFSFRNYFKNAINHHSGMEIQMGQITKTPGIFISHRVADKEDKTLGVLVVKVDLMEIPLLHDNTVYMLVNTDSIIKASNRRKFINKKLVHLSDSKIQANSEEFPGQKIILEEPSYSYKALRFASLNLMDSFNGWTLTAGIHSDEPRNMYLFGTHITMIIGLLLLIAWICRRMFIRLRIQMKECNKWKDALFKNNVNGMLVIDENLKIVELNDAMKYILGLRQGDRPEPTLEEIHLTPSETAKFRTITGKLFAGGKSYRGEHIFRNCRTNTMVSCKISVFLMPCYVPENNTYVNRNLVVWSCADETRYIELLDKLTQNEELYRSLTESSPEHLFMLDNQGCFMSSNNKRIAEQLRNNIPVTLSDYFSTETSMFYKTMIDNVFIMRHPLTFQHSVKTFEGEKYYNDTLYPIVRNGEIAAVGGISRDATKTKKMEEKLKKSEARLRDIGHSPLHIVWEADRNRVLTFCSENVSKLTGYSQNELIGAKTFVLIPPYARKELRNELTKAVRKHAPELVFTSIRTVEHGAQKILLYAVPLYDELGKFSGFRGVATLLYALKRNASDAVSQKDSEI